MCRTMSQIDHPLYCWMPEAVPHNFRDVGESINAHAAQRLLREATIFRGGEFSQPDFLEGCGVRTIVSLRSTPDPIVPGVSTLNVAPKEKMNNYLFASSIFKDWLSDFFHQMTLIEYPVYIHCTAGKDRTGVAIALLLKLLNLANGHIMNDYRKSAGTIYIDSMQAVLDGYTFSSRDQNARVELANLLLNRDSA
jgi:protein-tyrosine phosphatase